MKSLFHSLHRYQTSTFEWPEGIAVICVFNKKQEVLRKLLIRKLYYVIARVIKSYYNRFTKIFFCKADHLFWQTKVLF